MVFSLAIGQWHPEVSLPASTYRGAARESPARDGGDSPEPPLSSRESLPHVMEEEGLRESERPNFRRFFTFWSPQAQS